jgi:hypothetical protein
LIIDLLVASFISLALGTACVVFWDHVRYPDALGLLGIALSIACGPYFLWKRGRQPIIPIAAIFSVVMFFAIFVLAFVVAWKSGRVDL